MTTTEQLKGVKQGVVDRRQRAGSQRVFGAASGPTDPTDEPRSYRARQEVHPFGRPPGRQSYRMLVVARIAAVR